MRLDNGLLEPAPQLTPRQLEVLCFIWAFFRESETYPTHREIATGISANSTNVGPWLNALVKKGVLSKKTGTGTRNIRLTAQGIRTLQRVGVIAVDEQLEF